MVFWFGGIAGVGREGGVDLALATVPKLEFTAGVWASTFPDATEPAVGVNGRFAVPVGEHLGVLASVGYSARWSDLGGPAAGAGFTWDW